MTKATNYKECVQIQIRSGVELPAGHISPTPGAADSNLNHGTILAILSPDSQVKLEPVHMLGTEIVAENKGRLEAVGPAFLPISEAAYHALMQQLQYAHERITQGKLGDERDIVLKIQEILTFAEVVGPKELLAV